MPLKTVSSLQRPTDGERREAPAWGFLLYFTYRNLYFTTAPTAPTTAWYAQTAALKDPDLGLPQKTSCPLN